MWVRWRKKKRPINNTTAALSSSQRFALAGKLQDDDEDDDESKKENNIKAKVYLLRGNKCVDWRERELLMTRTTSRQCHLSHDWRNQK